MLHNISELEKERGWWVWKKLFIHVVEKSCLSLISAQQMTVIFLSVISHWWVQDCTTRYFYYRLNRICWISFVLLSVSSHTFMSVKYMQLSLEFIYLDIYGLLLYFSCRFSVGERKFPPFSAFNSATCSLKSIVKVFPGSGIYLNRNIARQV